MLNAKTHDNCYSNTVGVFNSNIILDSLMRAKSHYQVNTLPSYGRLNGTRRDGWCAKLNNDEQRLQVDLGNVIEVCAVAIQGDINGNKRVIDFKLAHSKSYEDGWPTYKDADGSEAAFFRPKCPSKPRASNISWCCMVRFSTQRFEPRNRSLLYSLIFRVRVILRR